MGEFLGIGLRWRMGWMGVMRVLLMKIWLRGSYEGGSPGLAGGYSGDGVMIIILLWLLMVAILKVKSMWGGDTSFDGSYGCVGGDMSAMVNVFSMDDIFLVGKGLKELLGMISRLVLVFIVGVFVLRV